MRLTRRNRPRPAATRWRSHSKRALVGCRAGCHPADDPARRGDAARSSRPFAPAASRPTWTAFVAPATPLDAPDDLLAPVARAVAPDGAAGDSTVVGLLPGDDRAVTAIARAAMTLADWFPRGLVPAAGRPLQCGADRPVRTFLNPQTLDLVGASRSCPVPAAVTGGGAGAVAERLDVGSVVGLSSAGRRRRSLRRRA